MQYKEKATNQEYVLNLPTMLMDCPKFWKNFIWSEKEHYELYIELAPYNARIIKYEDPDTEDIQITCVFETEEDFTFFKLRWT